MARPTRTVVDDPLSSPGQAGLRRTRKLAEVYAWLSAVAFTLQLFFVGTGPARFALALLVPLVLASWWLSPTRDSWLIAMVECVVAHGAAFVLPTPQPVIAFLFAVTLRRALRGDNEPFPVRAVPALLGYLSGCAVWIAVTPAAVTGPLVMAILMPLVGLGVGAMALHETTRSARLVEDAHRTVETVVRASPVGLVLVDADGAPRLHNDRARELLAWAAARPGRVPCPHGPDITACVRGCRSAQEAVEVRVTRPDGSTGVLAVHAVPVEHVSEQHTVITAVDVSKRRELEDELRTRAERDELTGLAGRTHFLHLVDDALLAGEDVGLLVIDLDGFKEVNDAEGHEAGDWYLVSAAERISRAVGPVATAARLGGDEFAVLAPGHDVRESARLATRILSELARPLTGLGHETVIRASVGIAVSAPGIGTADLLRDADTAMYVAKREGGGRIRLFRPEMGEQVLARQRDKADLRTAVSDGQLVLHYQPIVDLATSAAAGAEALVRWQRPGHGLLGPGEFIGLAEETGLIVPLGNKVLAGACEQAMRWLQQGRSLGVTVNVSTRQLSAPAFLPSLDRVLKTTGLPPERLTIEVTESVWADGAAMRGLMEVRETGVRVALDDFGTGYSSLSYLQRYPFDVVKIDRSFTGALSDTGRTAGVVRCIIDLAEVLGAHTVAEGIETQAQADWLRNAGCAYAQGYLFGRPDLAENWDTQPSVP
ncbi:EAL domain-containing protein [Saccharothrix sp. S26]|uniref:putative bifunctional diguanylate cyclase/phosphodiesterase n=1 Tax=Saccharothrix sp. S26 TaxID=2907215 RepID=UPI001F1654B2|nr:EAL domain-containing protein [Saccharothrix sp. S26]MCE7001133.1 EAL domain-containing protein [Saccharothrix sp. S26]